MDQLVRRAGNPDLGEFNKLTAAAAGLFDDCKRELLATFDALLAEKPDVTIKQLRDEASRLASHISDDHLIQREAPARAVSSDHEALFAGIQAPPHVLFEAKAASIASHGHALRTLAKTGRQARLYFEKRTRMKVPAAPKSEDTVFIGHGRSDAWKDLRDFLRDRLELRPDEFNLEPVAGMTTIERLEAMLDRAIFAFLVMTAEDAHAGATLHSRENVVHEAGLFQGRLGFKRAILLVEDGCAEFSNIVGLVQIRFPKGNIMAKSEEIRRVLEREGLLRKRERARWRCMSPPAPRSPGPCLKKFPPCQLSAAPPGGGQPSLPGSRHLGQGEAPVSSPAKSSGGTKGDLRVGG